MSLYDYGTKVWKERPPGPEQLKLDEMFESGDIDPCANAESVRSSSFPDFTPQVFAAHFRKTKAKFGEFGEFVSNKRKRGARGAVAVDLTENINASGSGQIPELGGSFPVSKPSFQIKSCEDSFVQMRNPPITTWMYTDHEQKNDYVCVAIPIFSGSKKISFDVSEDGLKVIAKFTWPSAIHNSTQFFDRAIATKTMTKHHPMVHAMASTMLDLGMTDTSSPEGQWVVTLPCKVRREVTSYTMEKIQHEGTNILFIKFTAFQKDLIIDQANRTVSFE